MREVVVRGAALTSRWVPRPSGDIELKEPAQLVTGERNGRPPPAQLTKTPRAQLTETPRPDCCAATPEVVVHRLADERYLVLACDGVFDVMTNAEAAGYVGCAFEQGERVRGAAGGLIKHAFGRKSEDNLTAIVATFGWLGSSSQGEAAARTAWMEPMRRAAMTREREEKKQADLKHLKEEIQKMKADMYKVTGCSLGTTRKT
jgi:serine/threonine protein phosphatase PrpC